MKKRKLRNGMRLLGAALLLSGMMLRNTPAAEKAILGEGGTSKPITATISVNGSAPEQEYSVTLKRVDADSPMPEGGEGGALTKSVKVSGGETASVDFGRIEYDRVGDYHYTVEQSTAERENYTLNTDGRSSYTITVRVMNLVDSENRIKESMGEVLYWAGDAEKDAKPGSISFQNSYTEPAPVTPPEGGGSSGGGGGGSHPTGGAVTPTSPNQNGPGVVAQVLGAVRESPVGEAISQIPQVLGAARNGIATGDESAMMLYGMLALLSVFGIGVWAVSRKKRM